MIYEWKCQECGTITDANRKVDDRDIPPDELSCKHKVNLATRIVSKPTTPWETLRDTGVFERLERYT